ncbi:xylan glycosyltransferase MUCI21-like [Wolffia australiana]
MYPFHLKAIRQTISWNRSDEMERGRRNLLFFAIIFSLASCSLIVPSFFLVERSPVVAAIPSISASRRLAEQERAIVSAEKSLPKKNSLAPRVFPCAVMKKNSFCCDRGSHVSDVCVLRGNVRTRPSSAAIFLYNNGGPTNNSSPKNRPSMRLEKIRPYPRNWDRGLMSTVDELAITVRGRSNGGGHNCDIVHRVPAVVFSVGGGEEDDLDREFSDGLIPLYITSRHYHRRVVFLIVNYRAAWRAKYDHVLSRLSAYPPIDFFGDNRTHCFPEVTVGLHSHGDLLVDQTQTISANQSINDFRRLLDEAYRPRIRFFEGRAKGASVADSAPKLVIIFGGGSAAVENKAKLVGLCKEMGFQVLKLRLDRTTELAKIYWALNSTDAVLSAEGSALAHLLFMRPGSVFINVMTQGTKKTMETQYEELAKEIGVVYKSYKLEISEMLVSEEKTKKVKLDLNRLLGRLTRTYQYIVARKMEDDNSSLRWNENWLPRRSE